MQPFNLDDSVISDQHTATSNSLGGLSPRKLMSKVETAIRTRFVEPYEHAVLEENLIQYLIEKVIIMREVPLMRATQLLERENNVRKITDKLMKIGTMTGFASKATNRKMIEA